VTDSPQGLAQYLAEHGRKCFPDRDDYRIVFKRHKPKVDSPSEGDPKTESTSP
jgi:hypothetical protein